MEKKKDAIDSGVLKKICNTYIYKYIYAIKQKDNIPGEKDVPPGIVTVPID